MNEEPLDQPSGVHVEKAAWPHPCGEENLEITTEGAPFMLDASGNWVTRPNYEPCRWRCQICGASGGRLRPPAPTKSSIVRISFEWNGFNAGEFALCYGHLGGIIQQFIEYDGDDAVYAELRFDVRPHHLIEVDAKDLKESE